MLSFVELLIVFDGLSDLLPNWHEYEGLEAEYGFQILRHYRSFGLLQCMLSAFFFARGSYVLWDNSNVPCDELYSLLECIHTSSSKANVSVFSQRVISDVESGKKRGLEQAALFLCDRKTAYLLSKDKELRINSGAHITYRDLIKEIEKTLKKRRLSVGHAMVRDKLI